jgi:hypothetical protein
MILLTIAGSTIGKWLRRVILALAQRAVRANRDIPQEFYRFPLF